MTAMLQQLTLNYAAGQVLWSYHTLMLLSLLLDPQLTGTTPRPDPTLDPNASAKAALGLEGLVQLLDLVIASEEQEHSEAENLARRLSTADSDSDSEVEIADGVSPSSSLEASPVQASSSAAAASAASLGPLLIRMLNGVAALLTGIAEELQALQWLLGQLQNQLSLPPGVRPLYNLLCQHLCISLHASLHILQLQAWFYRVWSTGAACAELEVWSHWCTVKQLMHTVHFKLNTAFMCSSCNDLYSNKPCAMHHELLHA